MGSRKIPDVKVYCDESGITQGRYLAIGSLWVPLAAHIPLQQSLAESKKYHGVLYAALEWKSITQNKLEAYKSFVDAFFDEPRVNMCSILVDNKIVDYSRFHASDKELGFYKFYYLLISRKLNPNTSYLVIPDKRSNRNPDRLKTLGTYIQYYGSAKLSPPASTIGISPMDSDNSDFIQLVDILLGAVRASYDNSTTNSAKLELINHICVRLFDTCGFNNRGLAHKNLRIKTMPSQKKFNIWHWQPRLKLRKGLQVE